MDCDANSFPVLFPLSLVNVFAYKLDVSEVLDGPVMPSGYRMVDSELPLPSLLLLTAFSSERLDEQMKEKQNKTAPRNIFKNYWWQNVLLSVPMCTCSIYINCI
jgi:hypothetical protein